MIDKSILATHIMQALLRERTTTRQALTRALGVRPATLLDVVLRLRDCGLVDEPERKGKRTGRRASVIRVARDQGVFVGVDFNAQRAIAAGTDMEGALLGEVRIEPAPGRDVPETLAQIVRAVEQLRQELGDRWARLRGIGFADPGLVDTPHGISLRAVCLPKWEAVNLREWAEDRFQTAALVYPSDLACAFIEYWQGDRSGSLLYVETDAGIGGGFVKRDEPFVGDSFCAMELGHLVIRPDGPLCACGNRGCLEAMAGLNGIRLRVEELARSQVRTLLRPDLVSFDHFADCVARQDRVACALANEVCSYVGEGVATAVTLLNPGVIVFRGGLTRLGERLIEPVRRVLEARCLPEALRSLTLRISTLPPHGEALGAAWLVRHEVLVREAARALRPK